VVDGEPVTGTTEPLWISSAMRRRRWSSSTRRAGKKPSAGYDEASLALDGSMSRAATSSRDLGFDHPIARAAASAPLSPREGVAHRYAVDLGREGTEAVL